MIEKAEDLTVYDHSSRIVPNLNQVWNTKMHGYAHLRHVVCTCIVVVAAGWAGSGEAAAGSGARRRATTATTTEIPVIIHANRPLHRSQLRGCARAAFEDSVVTLSDIIISLGARILSF